MTTEQLIIKLREFLFNQVTNLAKDNPMVSFLKPLLTRAIDNNIPKAKSLLSMLADSEGNIDIESIISEMVESVINTKPFTFSTGFMGDIIIGDGNIKLQVPVINKSLVLNLDDLENLKELLTSKS
jgi:Mg2+/Co2+ transporter CorC